MFFLGLKDVKQMAYSRVPTKSYGYSKKGVSAVDLHITRTREKPNSWNIEAACVCFLTWGRGS